MAIETCKGSSGRPFWMRRPDVPRGDRELPETHRGWIFHPSVGGNAPGLGGGEARLPRNFSTRLRGRPETGLGTGPAYAEGMAAWNAEDEPTYVDSQAGEDLLAGLPAGATDALTQANAEGAERAARTRAATLQGLSPYRPSAASVEIPVDMESTQQMPLREEDVPSVFGARPRAPSLAPDSHGALVVESSAVRVLRPLSYSVLAEGERPASGDGDDAVMAPSLLGKLAGVKRTWLIAGASAAAILLFASVGFGVTRDPAAAHAGMSIRARAEHPTRGIRVVPEAPAATKQVAKGARKVAAPRKAGH